MTNEIHIKPTNRVRLTCQECLVTFDLCVAPVAEWPELTADPNDDGECVITGCPFCGSNDLQALHDMPAKRKKAKK